MRNNPSKSFLLRVIRPSDLPDIQRLSAQAGYGMTSIKPIPALWKARLEESEATQTGEALATQRLYWFGLEDLETQKLIGWTGLRTYSDDLYWHLKREPIKTDTKLAKHIQVGTHWSYLELSDALKSQNMIFSLFLEARYRRFGLGRFLSLSRFLFLAAQAKSEKISGAILAAMRGWSSPTGESPFWNQIAGQKFGLLFEAMDQYRAEYGYAALKSIFPKYPFILDFFSKDSQAVMGQVHPETEAAKRLLINQNFKVVPDYFDPLDAGPILSADIEHITVVKNARWLSVQLASQKIQTAKKIATAETDSKHIMVANGLKNFRAIRISKNQVQTESKNIFLTQKQIDDLQIHGRTQKVIISD